MITTGQRAEGKRRREAGEPVEQRWVRELIALTVAAIALGAVLYLAWSNGLLG